MKTPISVALVDDHRLFRVGMAAILDAAEDMTVILQASNGHELLEQLADGAMPDVVLLDQEMPVMDGIHTLKALQKDHPALRVIVLTMHQEDAFIAHFMEAGAQGFLFKDALPTEVEAAIRKVAEGHVYFNDAVSAALLKGLQAKSTGHTWQPDTGESLSEREIEVLRGICQQWSTQEIADKLFLSPRTIEGYRKTLLEKTGAKNSAGLVVFAIRYGLFTVE